MSNYVFWLFAFPIENWYFNINAVKEKKYSQVLRDSYINRFPGTPKALAYERINENLRNKYPLVHLTEKK